MIATDLVGAAVSLVILIIAIATLRRRARAGRAWVATSGRVEHLEKHDIGEEIYDFPHVSYAFDGTLHGGRPPGLLLQRRYRIGQDVPILVDPSNSKNYVIQDPIVAPALIMSALVAVIIFGYSILHLLISRGIFHGQR